MLAAGRVKMGQAVVIPLVAWPLRELVALRRDLCGLMLSLETDFWLQTSAHRVPVPFFTRPEALKWTKVSCSVKQ